MQMMDFTSLFHRQIYDRDGLLTNLDGLLRTEPHMVTIIPYGSDKLPSDCFKVNYGNRHFSCLSSRDGVSLFELVYYSRRKPRNIPPIKGKFFVYENRNFPDTFILLTVEPQEFVNRALMPFIKRSYPHIYLTWIAQSHLKSLLENFKVNNGFTDLRVVRASIRSRFTRRKAEKETIIPSVSWPNLGLDGAFNFAEEQNGWFNLLVFEAVKNQSVAAEVTVTRNGLVRTDGIFLQVFNSLVSTICEVIHHNLKLFRKRSRRDTISLEVRPLTIKFDKDQLKYSEERIKLIDVMRLFKKASISVVHNNPYLQLSVIDYNDGSTFDLWVVNPSELILVPQLKGTVPAIRRLVGHIFDNYAEGNIADFQVMR